MNTANDSFDDLNNALEKETSFKAKIQYLASNLDSNLYDVLLTDQAAKLHKDNIHYHLVLFQIYVGAINRDYVKALKHLDAILLLNSTLDQDDINLIIYYKGKCYEELENYDEAISSYNSLLEQNSLSADYIYRLYRCHYKLENRNEAIYFLKRHIKFIESKDDVEVETVVRTNFDLYGLYIEYKKFEDADTVLNTIEDLHCDDNRLKNYILPFYRASVKYEIAENQEEDKRAENYERAIEILLKVIADNKADQDIKASCYYDIALYYSRLGKSAEALQYSNNVEEIYKRKIESHSGSSDDIIALYKSICQIIRNSLVYLCQSYSEDNTNTFLTEVDNKLNIAQEISSSYSIQTSDIRDLGVVSVKKIQKILEYCKLHPVNETVQYILIRLTLECDKLLEKLKFSPRVVEYPLYHYTSFDNLRFILSPISKNRDVYINTLRASHSSQLNDSLEGNLLKELLENACGEATEILSSVWKCYDEDYQQTQTTFDYDTYILCFSKCVNRDFLPMWSMYGNKGDGINISIKFEKLKAMLTELSYNPKLTDDNFNSTAESTDSIETLFSKSTHIQVENDLFEVAYLDISSLDKNIKFQTIANLICEFNNIIKTVDSDLKKTCIEYVAKILNPLRFVFKAKSYEYEKEIRVIITNVQSTSVFNWRSLKDDKFFHLKAIDCKYFNVLLGPKFKHSSNDALIDKLKQSGASSVDVSTINYR